MSNNKEEEDVSNITQLILNFYNKDFNKNEENPLTNDKILNKNFDNIYKKVFSEKPQVLEEEKILKTIKKNPTNDTISNINFIENKKLCDKILKYKLLEIRKQIAILKYIFVLYKYNVILVCHESSDLDPKKNEIATDYIKILEQYIKNYIINEREQNLKKALEEYTNLNDFLINKNKQINK